MFFLPGIAFAEEVEMADVMRSNGKIYVVVAVVVTILVGILLYIFQTEKKLKKLEKEIETLKKEG
jgi:CcmD family protein